MQPEVRIYSNAFDGFTSIRQMPDSQAPIIGRLNNGTDYLSLVNYHGEWLAVKWQNRVGYVKAHLVGYTPAPPVYLGVDANYMGGIYGGREEGYLVFGNGKFARFYNYSDVAYGKWRFEGYEIVFTTKYVNNHGSAYGNEYVGKVRRLQVNVGQMTIGGYRKVPTRSSSYYERLGECSCCWDYITKEDYQEYRKTASRLVR